MLRKFVKGTPFSTYHYPKYVCAINSDVRNALDIRQGLAADSSVDGRARSQILRFHYPQFPPQFLLAYRQGVAWTK
jgi:hypothetical protein